METPEDRRIEEAPLQRRKWKAVHCLTTSFVILLGMIILDAYIVEQNTGSRKTGVLVMLIIGELCLCLALRYLAVWVGGEVTTTRRKHAMIEWFIFAAVFELKVFFIFHDMRNSCPLDDSVKDDSIQPTSKSYVSAEMMKPKNTDSHLDNQNVIVSDIVFSARKEELSCEYSLISRKILTLTQALVLNGLYMLLVGADYLKSPTQLRELEEIKMRAFWFMIDITDILELQSMVWERKTDQVSETIVSTVFFYGYMVLMVFPPLSLAEMSKSEGQVKPHIMFIYLIASLLSINVTLTIFRFVLLFHYELSSVSSLFIGKNIICIGMKVTKLIQMWLSRKATFSSYEEPIEDDGRPVLNGNACFAEDSSVKMDVTFPKNVELNCPQHGFKKRYRSCECEAKPITVECLNHCELQNLHEISESSTLPQVTASTSSHTASVITPQSYLEDDKVDQGNISKQVKFHGRRKKIESRSLNHEQLVTSESDAGSSNTKPCRSNTKIMKIKSKASSLDHSSSRFDSSTWNGKESRKHDFESKEPPCNPYNQILTPPPYFANSSSNKSSPFNESNKPIAHVATSPRLRGQDLCQTPCSQMLSKYNSRSLGNVVEFPMEFSSDYNEACPYSNIKYGCDGVVSVQQDPTSELMRHTRSTDSDISNCAMPPRCPALESNILDQKTSQNLDSDAESTSV